MIWITLEFFWHRSYLVYNCYIKITKWPPDLDIGVESPVIPIWIFFLSLRPHLFAPKILHALGSLFGHPLKIDFATSLGSRPSLARVLVELDIMKNYPEKVWLDSKNLGYVQQVQMEVFPLFCDLCKSIGHKQGDCRSSSTATKLVSSSKHDIPATHEAVGEGVLNEYVNPISLGIDPDVPVSTPKLLPASPVVDCDSLGRSNSNVVLMDSMVDGSVPAIHGQRLCVSEPRGGNYDVNLQPIMSCATSVPAKCGLFSAEVPCVLAKKSDSSISSSKSNSSVYPAGEVSARLVAHTISSAVMPIVVVHCPFVDVPVNLISLRLCFLMWVSIRGSV
ncbi:hypothetical protein MA16_Dca008923 [Dendrobium catenatum]|uniref:Uncharacterized protein n=1 Tax=Dendrobium catenatum TaxID=906689 RepID=A0A2I0WRK7_9ASPA|nr:hypothetical protein MA16_Dca008923 [Dendrobium catenatum]